jgi:hypothetical protein
MKLSIFTATENELSVDGYKIGFSLAASTIKFLRRKFILQRFKLVCHLCPNLVFVGSAWNLTLDWKPERTSTWVSSNLANKF